MVQKEKKETEAKPVKKSAAATAEKTTKTPAKKSG